MRISGWSSDVCSSDLSCGGDPCADKGMARTLVSARHGAKRCYAPFPYRCSSGATDGGGDFGREIILLFLDDFAELESHIAGKRNRRTSFLARFRIHFHEPSLYDVYERIADTSVR